MVKGNLIGGWAFLIGVVLAIVLGVLDQVSGNMLTILVVIGFVVGLLNIADKEAMPFLISGLALVIISSLGQTQLSTIAWLDRILAALLAIFVPATAIVAIKNVFSLARH